MKTGVHLIAFGEILWDMIDGKAHIGGAPLNLAAHAVRCGLRSAIVSSVGNDHLGHTALGEMDRLGVERKWTMIDNEHPTGTVTVTLNAGQPCYTIHEHTAWDFINLSAGMLQALSAERPRVVCFGTLAQRSAMSRNSLERLLDTFKEAVIFYDVNLRQSFWSADRVDACLARSTLVKVNDEEARLLGRQLFGDATAPVAFSQAVLSKHPLARAIVVTLGSEGCIVTERGKQPHHCPGIKIRVADAVGAGDAFSAAFLASWLNGATGAIAAEQGNKRGAWVASQVGAVPDEN